MSTDADKETACPSVSANQSGGDGSTEEASKKKKSSRKVCFPDEEHLVTQYFEPANPWHNVPATTRAQLAADYLESCRRHNTPAIDSVLLQIRELPEGVIGGGMRAPRLTLSCCSLLGSAPCDALEAVLHRAQFRRLELECDIDDEGAEALFDMIEYYESATTVAISGPRHFGIRGWQAASRMIKKSAELSELEVSDGPIEASHAPVLARALRPAACRLRALCLQRAALAGEALLCLVIALKCNRSVRELRLCDNRLTGADAAQIAALLKINSRIQLLDLSNNQIQDAGVGHIADALVEQSTQSPPSATSSPMSPHTCPMMGGGHEARGLAFLVLWNNQLTRNAAHHLARMVRASKSLCVLNVGRNAIGAAGVRVAGAGALLSLGLQGARILADAAPLLQQALAQDTHLQRIDLRDNRLGAEGLQAILAAMETNTTLTQVDLDDPVETSSPSEELVARLTREVRALCRRNEPAAASPERRVTRKISLTCHTHCLHRSLAAEEPRAGREGREGRLRSPAPSPAGSPTPAMHPSRFSVTRVTPERSPTDTAALRSPYSTPSRFKVVQVAEPPQIQVQSATPEQPTLRSSRFSVTRNMDTMYNPSAPSPPPTPMTTKHKPNSGHTDCTNDITKVTDGEPVIVKNTSAKESDEITITKVTDNVNETVIKNTSAKESYKEVTINKVTDNVNETVIIKDTSVNDSEKEDVKTEKTKSDKTSDETVVNRLNSVTVSDSELENVFHDKTESLSHDEAVSVIGDNKITKTETKLVKNSKAVSESEMIDVQVSVTVKKETVDTSKARDQIKEEKVVEKRDDVAMKQIEAITEDLGNLIEEMRDRTKTVKPVKVSDCTQTDINIDSKLDTFDDVPVINRDNVVLKKNKSESSLDSPDLEVSRLMNKKLIGSPFCDSSSSLEISGSSMESLNAIEPAKPIIIQESVESDSELDRRKTVVFSTESSIESTSEVTPVNSGNFLNMSVSSNESVSPIIFGKNKKIHGSLSSLEASVSSLESRQEKVMVTSADSGIEYSLQNPTENKEDNSSNEGTLTNNSSLKETVKKDGFQHETLTCSPKRTSSLLDVPALKTKGLDRMRKISWVAPSASFHIPKEPEKESKMPGHLEKLLSLFQHPTSIFSRNSEDEKKSASNTPPRKDSSLTSSFWSWGSATEKTEEREDVESLSEATDSTLSERVQVSFVDESFSKKLDSKTPSTDTDNTLSEFQSLQQGNSEASEPEIEKVTEKTTDDNLVQNLGLSLKCDVSANGNRDVARARDILDLSKPNDLNKNYDTSKPDTNKNAGEESKEDKDRETIRPRSFAAVLKASGSENTPDKQSPETGQPVDKLPSKVIRGIKENISPENTLTSTMTKALAFELTEKQVKSQPIVNTVWEVTLDNDPKVEEKNQDLAPIATIEETCDETIENAQLDYIDDIKFDDKNTSSDSGVTLEGEKKDLESVDLGKDALSYLIYENQGLAVEKSEAEPSLAQELRDAEIKEQLLDMSPELIVDEAIEPEVFKDLKTSPVIPERAKLKKSNSAEDISQCEESQKKTIAFKVPEVVSTPRDIPERRTKLRSRSGSSPKSLPESLNKPSPLTKMDSILFKKKKKVSSLGKIARDSLLALNMSEEEIAEFRRSYKLTSVESLRSLESVSEDANSQSGASVDSRCRSCLRTSQESLMSLDSINEDCRCGDDEKQSQSGR
ncbi:microtubule-associated protein futsch [Cydia fagiglandana]|uniref:microtubule-associated protein futsch n=1 Tax=Cydia fagiglandana TaxID=1458189 RepID=UPI002FEE411D